MGAGRELIDAYAVLGVDKKADQAELKRAHRRLVRRHHPDLAPPAKRRAATRRVQDINVAYGLVRDPASRAAYDRVLAERRRKEAVATVDRELGRRWEELLEQAGKWAATWWARNRKTLERSAARAVTTAERAGRELFARLLWLASCLVGALLGTAVALTVGPALTDGVGALTPVAGALCGGGVGWDRGRRLRHRIVGRPRPTRHPALTPVLAVLALAAAIGIDGLLAT